MIKKNVSLVNKNERGERSTSRDEVEPLSSSLLTSDQFAHYRATLSPSGDSRSLEAILAIRSISHQIESKLATWIAPTGLSLGQFSVLMSLWGSEGNRRSMSEVTRALVSSPANATKLVIQLEEAGLVQREADPTDKRVVVACLTKKGKQKMSTIAPAQIARIESAMKPVQGWVCEALVDHLKQVQRGFLNYDENDQQPDSKGR